MSLCTVLRPSFTPVRSFTVTGTSPNARFMPTMILPSLFAASSTVCTRCQPETINRDEQLLTCRTASRLVHQINRAPAVDIDKVDTPRADLAYDFSSGDEQLWFAAGDLHAKDTLGGMPAYKRPLLLRALQERVRQTHWGGPISTQALLDSRGLTFSAGDIRAEIDTDAAEGLRGVHSERGL